MTLNALSVDLEEYFQVSNFDQVIDRADWDRIPSRLEEPTHRLLDLFDETDSKATFFVLGWIAERHGPLVREIASRGHEIACHGYGHELVYKLGPDRFRDDVTRAKAAIEDVTGTRVEGYRAPSYSITADSFWALNVLAEEGFLYDSSIFPIRHYRYGVPNFRERPVLLQLDGGATIREFPLTTLSIGPVKLPLAGGAYFRFLPSTIVRRGLSILAARGEPTVIYLHPWELDPDQPRQRIPWWVALNHYHNLHLTERRLRNLLRGRRSAGLAAVLGKIEADGLLHNETLERASGGPRRLAAS